jgi:hypothetical protein
MKKNDVLIFSYTRAQAIADGVLIDVSELAKEAGFRFPVAVTAGLWAECVALPDGVTGQSETGRLWDVLNMLRFATLRQKGDAERVDFALHVRNDNREGIPPLVRLYALCGPGDDAEPVVTVMLPWED